MHRIAYRKFAVGGWRGRVHPEWTGVLRGPDPLEALLRQPNDLFHERETARTWRIDAPQTTLYAKLEHGQLAGPLRQWEWGLKLLLGHSPARRTFAVSRRMAACGIGVPTIVLAARRRVGLRRVEDLLITERAPGTVLARIMQEPVTGEGSAAIPEMLGRRVAALHNHGFIHGHLLRGHIYISDDRTDAVFIDNDETRCWWPQPPARKRRHNLEQFTIQAWRHWGYAMTRRWLQSYFDASGITGRDRRRMHRRVLANVRARRRRRERRGSNERPRSVSA